MILTQPLLVDILQRGGEGSTLLHVAAEAGNTTVGKMLLASGLASLVDAPNGGGYTALHLSSMQGHYQFVQLLLNQGASPLATTTEGHTALHYAATFGLQEIAFALGSAAPATVATPDKMGVAYPLFWGFFFFFKTTIVAEFNIFRPRLCQWQ